MARRTPGANMSLKYTYICIFIYVFIYTPTHTLDLGCRRRPGPATTERRAMARRTQRANMPRGFRSHQAGHFFCAKELLDTYMCVYVYICICVCMYIYTYMCTCACACVYISKYVCVHTHNIHTRTYAAGRACTQI